MTKANKIQIGLLSAIAVLLLYLVFTGGFGGSSSDNSARDAARANLSQNKVANTPVAKAKTPPKPVGPTTTMSFSEKKFDFGSIDEGEKVTHIFKFENTGKEPLVISNAQGSCGCTVPQYSKKPIAPGETGEIKVQFDSKGRPGKQSKTVTVTANTDPVTTTLQITADVAKDPNAPAKPAPKPTVTPAKGK